MNGRLASGPGMVGPVAWGASTGAAGGCLGPQANRARTARGARRFISVLLGRSGVGRGRGYVQHDPLVRQEVGLRSRMRGRARDRQEATQVFGDGIGSAQHRVVGRQEVGLSRDGLDPLVEAHLVGGPGQGHLLVGRAFLEECCQDLIELGEHGVGGRPWVAVASQRNWPCRRVEYWKQDTSLAT